MGKESEREQLEKDYLKYSDSGKNSLKGYNFQTYSGIYFMICLNGKNKNFKIGFEKEDDIVIYLDDLKYKIQAKSSELQWNKIISNKKEELSILEKLLIDPKNEFDFYKLCFPHGKFNGFKELKECHDRGIGKECKKMNRDKLKEGIDKLLEEKKIKVEQVIFQEFPFNDDIDSIKSFLIGDALRKTKLEFSESQLNSLAGLIFEYSASNNSEKKYLNEKFFKEISEENKIQKKINVILEEIKNETNEITKNKYKLKILEIKNSKIYIKKLKTIKIDEIEEEEKTYEYIKRQKHKLENELELQEKEIAVGYAIMKYAERLVQDEEKWN